MEAHSTRSDGGAHPRLGCVLVHGLTSSPACFAEFTPALQDAGIDVEAVLLPGHGTRPEDLLAVSWQAWRGAVAAGITTLRRRCDRVFVLGQSLGGTLALDAARRQPVDGVITLAAIVWLRDWRLRWLPWIRRWKRWHASPGNDIARSGIQDPGSYDRVPLHALQQLLEAAGHVRRHLPEITVPALLFHGRQDHVAPPGNAEELLERLGSEDKQLVWLAHSYHVLSLDRDRHHILETSLDFIRRVAAAPTSLSA